MGKRTREKDIDAYVPTAVASPIEVGKDSGVSSEFQKFISEQASLQQLQDKRLKKRKAFFKKLVEQVKIPIACAVLIVVLLVVYSFMVYDHIVWSAKNKKAAIEQQVEALREEVVTLEKTKTELETDPKILKETKAKEKQIISEKLITTKLDRILDNLLKTSSGNTSKAISNNVGHVTTSLGITTALLADLQNYENQFGVEARVSFVTLLLSDGNRSEKIKRLRSTCVRGGEIFATDVFLRTSLVTDYIATLILENNHPQDVVLAFGHGFESYLRDQQSDDFYKVTEAIASAEKSLQQISQPHLH